MCTVRFGSFEIFKTRDQETGRAGPSVGRGDIFHNLLDFVTQSYYPQVCVVITGYFICTCIQYQTTVKRRLAYYIQYLHKTWCTCRVLEDGVKESRRVYILKCLYNYRAHISFSDFIM